MTDRANDSRRPRVICHMIGSLDGRILVGDWPMAEEGRREYERVHAQYDADGWLCGRNTMEDFAERVRTDEEIGQDQGDGVARDDFVAPGEHTSYAFAMDSRGRLVWESGELDGDHLVAVLGNRVGDEYLATLRERGVSYLLAGDDQVDVSLALDKIGERFGLRTLMLEGGGRINGAMLQAGLIDEVSLLLAPVADGRMGTPSLFDAEPDEVTPRRLTLEGVEPRGGGLLWLRYRVSPRH